ncbi:MAG: hypothetical protein K5786_10710 [Treponema sp.]|nr:hypothetical protein [Treponema sp.]
MKKLSIMLISMMMLAGSLFAQAKEVVVFDPATTKVDVGEVVTIDGEKYLKLAVNGYETQFNIPEVDLSKCNSFSGKIFAESEIKNCRLTVKIADAGNSDIASLLSSTPTKAKPEAVTVGRDKKEAWNTISKTYKGAIIQPFFQDTSSWNALKGHTVFIGKITAK